MDPAGAFHAVPLDLASTDSIEEWANRLAEVGPLDVVVNTAAGFSRAALGEADPGALESLVHTNFTGPMLVLNALLRRDLLRAGSNVVNVTSLGSARSFDASRSSAAHIASKAALGVLGISGGDELARLGIRASTVAPATLEKSGRSGIDIRALASTILALVQLDSRVRVETLVVHAMPPA